MNSLANDYGRHRVRAWYNLFVAMPPSSSGLGRGPLKAQTAVRNRLGAHFLHVFVSPLHFLPAYFPLYKTITDIASAEKLRNAYVDLALPRINSHRCAIDCCMNSRYSMYNAVLSPLS